MASEIGRLSVACCAWSPSSRLKAEGTAHRHFNTNDDDNNDDNNDNAENNDNKDDDNNDSDSDNVNNFQGLCMRTAKALVNCENPIFEGLTSTRHEKKNKNKNKNIELKHIQYIYIF